MNEVNSAVDSLIEKNKYEDILTDYVNELNARSKQSMKQEFADLRKFSLETVEQAGIFYIGDAAEMMIPSYLDVIGSLGVISPTNKKPIFHDRYIIPIKTPEGKVQNLVGYNKYADERYIYGTAKYYRRRDTFYGLENLGIAYQQGYAIVTEGITDAIMMRNLGYPMTFGWCGTHKSSFMVQQLNRCRHGVLKIPDRDAPGARAAKSWDFNRSVTLNVNIRYKDVDEMCHNEENMETNRDLVVQYVTACIDWLKQSTHDGNKGILESVTIV